MIAVVRMFDHSDWWAMRWRKKNWEEGGVERERVKHDETKENRRDTDPT